MAYTKPTIYVGTYDEVQGGSSQPQLSALGESVASDGDERVSCTAESEFHLNTCIGE
jgi:hypothetical protein